MNDLHDMTSDDRARLLREYFMNSTRLSDIVGILLRMSKTLNLMKWILALNAIELGTLTAMTIWLIGG